MDTDHNDENSEVTHDSILMESFRIHLFYVYFSDGSVSNLTRRMRVAKKIGRERAGLW